MLVFAYLSTTLVELIIFLVFFSFSFFFFLFLFFFFFFFSSRRRHTRYIGDWSSDVCSSDLGFRCGSAPGFYTALFSLRQHPTFYTAPVLVAAAPLLFLLTISRCGSAPAFYTDHFLLRQRPAFHTRSEGRSVGKEGRYRWTPAR